jgi:hypothetical protein
VAIGGIVDQVVLPDLARTRAYAATDWGAATRRTGGDRNAVLHLVGLYSMT